MEGEIGGWKVYPRFCSDHLHETSVYRVHLIIVILEGQMCSASAALLFATVMKKNEREGSAQFETESG